MEVWVAFRGSSVQRSNRNPQSQALNQTHEAREVSGTEYVLLVYLLTSKNVPVEVLLCEGSRADCTLNKTQTHH